MTMENPRIALLPGDGIGGEVLDAALRVLDAVGFRAEYVRSDIGWEFWKREGEALPSRTIEVLKGCRAALFGAITSKPAPEAEAELVPELRGCGIRYRSPIVRLRQEFNLYAAVRPCRAFAGNPRNVRHDVDLVIFRENTEGLYAGLEWLPVPEGLARGISDSRPEYARHVRAWSDFGASNVALSMRVTTRGASERIIRAAFDYAVRERRRRVTLLEKPNVLRETGGLMTKVFREIAAGYPSIEAVEANVDAACMQLVTDPARFDVLVAENMFGDIVSDLAAGLVGGLGFAPSSNIGPDLAIFEPVHGSAPDIAGRGIANPIAMILSAAMMLRHLGEHERASRITAGVERVIAEGLVNTCDVLGPGASGTTEGIARLVAERAV